ncbi:MAG: ACT domain-containing protein [Clostridia bacterium]|nr:ACT domain-containing protein [Clostridia bacterium]
MIIKQLSVFVENKKGRLQAITQVLADNDIDISALSLADTSDFGVLRLIVNKPDEAKAALNESGVVVKITDVVAVVMDDAPGGVAAVLKVFLDNEISVEYMYACVGKTTGKALMVVKTDDVTSAESVLESAGFALANPADIYRI